MTLELAAGATVTTASVVAVAVLGRVEEHDVVVVVVSGATVAGTVVESVQVVLLVATGATVATAVVESVHVVVLSGATMTALL